MLLRELNEIEEWLSYHPAVMGESLQEHDHRVARRDEINCLLSKLQLPDATRDPRILRG